MGGVLSRKNFNLESLKWYFQHFEDAMRQKTIVFNSLFTTLQNTLLTKHSLFPELMLIFRDGGSSFHDRRATAPLPAPLAFPLDRTCKIDMQTERSLKIYHIHFRTIS
jgi:hypothetical protein